MSKEVDYCWEASLWEVLVQGSTPHNTRGDGELVAMDSEIKEIEWKVKEIEWKVKEIE